MEQQPTTPSLTFISSPWLARLSGVSIFFGVLFVYFYFPNVPAYVLVISFCFMVVALLFAAEVLLVADNSLRTLTITKKRIFGSSQVTYLYDDIVFLCQSTSTSIDQNGQKVEAHSYSIGLNSQTTTIQPNYRGRRLVPITIPVSAFTSMSAYARGLQEYARARMLADFIKVPLYIQGSDHDTLANIVEDTPGYIEEIRKLPETIAQVKDAMAAAKEDNDRTAQEILRDEKKN